MKKLFLIVLFSCLVFPSNFSHAAADPIRFAENDRVLVIAPHPDDESLGTGGVIQAALEARADVRVLYLTHGDFNEMASIVYEKRPMLASKDFIKSGLRRKKEAIGATALLGLPEKNLVFLGYPDFGTLSIWKKNWGIAKPFRSFLTRINRVPYKDDFSYGIDYKGENIVSDFEKNLDLFRPTQIFITPPFDLNPDHRAVYLYLQVALLNLEKKIGSPKVYQYLIHTHQWPELKGYKPELALEPPSRLSRAEGIEWISFKLRPEQVERKRQALLTYKSQMAYSRNFLLSFARANELFFQRPYEKLVLEKASSKGAGEETIEKEPNAQEVEYRIRGKELWVDVRLSSALDEMGALSVEVHSYRKGTSFTTMPKLSMGLLGDHLFVKNRNKSLYGSGIHYNVKKKRVWIQIPMTLLQDPDYLFVSTHTAKEELSLDFGSWRVLEVEKTP